ncbi:MAG TPA: hypothetical protein VFE51_29145 [Verrucomicrobiae bacterium]|nr:hypothetical protein [Verrucomicrobiae bacterium]
MNQLNASHSQAQGWLFFSLITVGCWGLYGAFLHSGQTAMQDPVHGRYKAFLWVGIAYFLTAVLAPLAILLIKGASWTFTSGGIAWSLFAGILGAAGAFSVLLAFGAKGSPAVVMSIVFAGAPVLNAIYSLVLHPPAGGWSKLPIQFVLGILLAAVGGCLVSLYKPAPASARPTAPASQSASALNRGPAGQPM